MMLKISSRRGFALRAKCRKTPAIGRLKNMNTLLRLAVGVFAAILLPPSVRADECPNAYREVPIERIERMFEQMKGKAKWNTEAPMVWGYFFFDPAQDQLAGLAEEMKSSGYRLIELFKGAKMYTLHVERIEIHTPASLFKRNAELGALATARCIKLYDGYDVSPVR